MKNHFATFLIALALGVFPVLQAQAHFVWIESDGAQSRVQFGEFGDNLREVSPGRLDSIAPTTAIVVTRSGQKDLTLTKTANALVAKITAGPGESIIFDANRQPVAEKTIDGATVRTAPTRSARFVSDFSAQTPQLTLDIVPTGRKLGTRVEFQVVFRNAPAPKLKLAVLAASGWERPLETDEKGMFLADFPWKGVYVIDAKHDEAVAGKRDGHAYDKSGFRTTLSFALAAGLESPPAPPVLTPKPVN
ncbi:MAG: cobalt ABC transporter substrate-binding protein [Alphaproteobacteria bacterium]